jgi:hypothetical protein
MAGLEPASHRYRLMKKLGEGGMGAVYEAYDENLARPVAVKTISPELASDKDALTRFFHEAEILGSLDHPGVPPVYERGILPTPALPFYAMKLVRGRTLTEVMADCPGEGVPNRERIACAVSTFCKICECVAHANARRIVHRDLKPSNIMVDEFGAVIVLDWGLAKRLDAADEALTRPGFVVGSPGHMSPEQAEGRAADVDCRTDVFTLGIILYQLLTGTQPFPGSSAGEKMASVVNVEPARPCAVNGRVPRVLDAICMKALAKEPGNRSPSAVDLADEVERYTTSRPTTACKTRIRDHAAMWSSRHPAWSAGLGTAFVLVVALASGLVAFRRAHVAMEKKAHAAADRLVETLTPKLRGFEERLIAIEEEMSQLPDGDTAARGRLEREARMLRVGRDAHMGLIRSSVGALMGRFGRDPDAPFSGLDPALMARLQEHRLEQIERFVRTGDLYQAHYSVWQALVRGKAMGWSDEQTQRLLDLRSQVEALMREEAGPDFELPRWEEYDPHIGVEGITSGFGLAR